MIFALVTRGRKSEPIKQKRRSLADTDAVIRPSGGKFPGSWGRTLQREQMASGSYVSMHSLCSPLSETDPKRGHQSDSISL